VVVRSAQVSAMRIVFCGTPEFAVPSLERLAAEPGISVEAVITQPDRPRGRGQQVSGSPVKEAALAANLHVYQPETVKSDSAQEFLKRVAPDAVVIIAYGQIIPARLLTIPRLGWINLHASLLPHYRGAAPIHWAIAKGETITGLTTMQIDAGMDTGPTLLQHELKIGADETSPELAARMSEIGAGLIVDSLLRLDRGEISPLPQEREKASYAPILKKEDGRIDWTLTAQQIYNRMRGFAPWPGAYTTFRGQTCHVWGRPEKIAGTEGGVASGGIVSSTKDVHVVCGEGTYLRLESVQLEGRKRISAREFANGARFGTSESFV
jgi:methionyl-tRNA formyltransferase